MAMFGQFFPLKYPWINSIATEKGKQTIFSSNIYFKNTKQVYSFYVVISLCIPILITALHSRIMENIFLEENYHFKPKIGIKV